MSTSGGAPSGLATAFAPFTVYKAGQLVVQAGTIYQANAAFTSGAAFNAGDWTATGGLAAASVATITARWRFSVMPEIFGAGGDTVPILMRAVGDGITQGKFNLQMDGVAGDGVHMTTGPNTGPSRTVADAATTNGSTTITSATAAFTTGPVITGVGTDVGKTVTGAGIPAGTTIASVTNATTAVLSQPATASASGVSLTFGSGPNANGCVIAIGVDNGGTGIITRNKSTGIALHVDQLDSVSSPSAYAALMYHESHIAPFSLWSMAATATQPMVKMAPTVAGAAAAGSIWLEVNDNNAAPVAGRIFADTGKITWFRTIETYAPNGAGVPLLQVGDEIATNPTVAFLKAKTTAEAGLTIWRNTTGVAGNVNVFGGRIVMDTSNADRLSIEALAGAVDRTTITGASYKKMIAMRGSTGTTGGIGFFGATPAAQQTGTPAAATDLASVIALANSLRTSLINYGLVA